MVISIRYINITAAVYGYTVGVEELAVAIASAAPHSYNFTVATKLLDAMVAIVHYIDSAAAVYNNTQGSLELTKSMAAALIDPLG